MEKEPAATQRAIAFYDRAAASYDRRMAMPEARRMRRAFHALVRERVALPGPILDFGCGTGVDARHYAWLGYRVLAYDPSRAMLSRLERRCPKAIRAGQIVAAHGALADCLAAARGLGPFACITSNFGAFNHIDDPGPVLTELAALLVPGGHVILSLLNPWYWRDVRSGWWWRSRLRSVGHGGFVVDLGENRTIRHAVSRIGHASGLHRKAIYGAMRGRFRDHVPGRVLDALVVVTLTRE
jgi:SAM-dependent methyltransferase